jgi:hypothetical protein
MCDTELTVSYPLTISLRTDGLDFNGLVQAIQTAAKRASGQLLGLALRQVEQQARQREPDRWVNRGQAERRVRVPWGEVTVRRTRVRDRQTGKTYNLADRLMGLRRYVRRGIHEIKLACELTVSMSYRQAHHWWQRITERRCSLMNFWRMVQEGGRRLVRRERDEVGEVRKGDPPPRAVRRLYLEADGVWLRHQPSRRATHRKRGQDRRTDLRGMLVYVGASYSRLEQTGRGRRNAVDKQTLTEVGSVGSFARQWAWQVSRRFALSRTPNQLYLSDGDDGLSRIPGRYFKHALVQLDRFHVHRQLGRAFGRETAGYRAALSALCAGDLGRVRSLLALRGRGDRFSVCQEVREYLNRHAGVLYTHEEWMRRTTVRKLGSGVIEKTIETHINRRMKKQGMSWSSRGAEHVSKLRALSWNRARWEGFWSEQAM